MRRDPFGNLVVELNKVIYVIDVHSISFKDTYIVVKDRNEHRYNLISTEEKVKQLREEFLGVPVE